MYGNQSYGAVEYGGMIATTVATLVVTALTDGVKMRYLDKRNKISILDNSDRIRISSNYSKIRGT